MAELSLVDLLRKLVSIPSVNPMLADDPAIGTEKPLAEFMAGFLERRGFQVDWIEPIAGRPNVVGRFGPAQPRRSILVESHIDTQGIHGMTVPPFEGGVRDGRLYGRGACDTKGPMAAALHALQPELLHRLAEAGVQVIYVGAVGEEKGNVGAEQLADLQLGADEALILEPTELAIVHAHKGAMWFEVETRGRAAHGSNPRLGVNAIQGMLKVIQGIEADVAAVQQKPPHPLLGQATVNFGLIRGGSSINIVPDRCVLEVDRRTLPGEDNAAILSRVRQQLAALEEQGLVTGWDVRAIKDGTPFETTASSRLVQRLAASCRGAGEPGRTEGAAWYSDAGPFARTCREVAVFGPGSITQAHTVDEYIELASLEKGRAILFDFFTQLAVEHEGAKA